MNVFDVLSGFIPLLVMGALTYGVVRLARRAHGKHEIDPAALTRQVALYGLLYLTMILTAVGVIWIYGELASDQVRQDNRDLAGALALLALGLPVFTTLLAYVDRRLRLDAEERESLAWSGYLTLASMTALIGTMVGAYQVISATIDTGRGAELDDRSIVLTLTWGLLFAVHWVFLRVRHGLRWDLHLAAGSLVGLVPMVIGQAGLTAVLAERAYDEMFDRPISDLNSESSPWAALFVIGCAAWIGIWLRQYEPAPRTEAWYVTVLPVGALAGFVAVLGTTARLAYLALVWVVGDTNDIAGADHFDDVPVLIGIGMTGVISWVYHRSFVSGTKVRSDAVRSYDYLLMGASLVTGAIGAVLIISSLLDRGFTDRNLALAGITLFVVGGVTWSRIAAHVVAQQTDDGGVVELRSPVRRSYLYATLGVGGLAVLIAGISALEGVFEDVLDEVVSVDTIVNHREQLSVAVLISGVVAFHALVLRSDQRRLSEIMPPPPSAHWPSRIIVLGGTSEAPIDVAGHPGTSVEYWHRTDRPVVDPIPGSLDAEQLEEVLAAQQTDDVLVLLNGETPTVIPFVR